MNEQIRQATLKLSRRAFAKGAAGLTFSFVISGIVANEVSEALAQSRAELSAWVTIGVDNKVTIICPAAEMGQGVLTSLPLILAEELDADWSTVTWEFAPISPGIYGNPGHPIFPRAQLTSASASVHGYFTPLRIAGAQARRVLIDNVAAAWNVPADALSTHRGVVFHKASGRKISYGDIAKFAKVPEELPRITEADLKSPAKFELIGGSAISRVDVPSKVNGTARFGIDVQVPGMVYAAVLQAPMDGASAQVRNLNDVSAIGGVSKVIPLPFGVAVIGESVEATRAGRAALKINWDTAVAAAANTDSNADKEDYARLAKDPGAKAVTHYKVGNAAAALANAAKIVEASFWTEYLYHAQMEPMNAVAQVAEDGLSAEIWTGTQFGTPAVNAVAHLFKTTPDKIKVHQQLLGGGFGRRIGPDAAIQAAILSSIVKKPVKLLFTREDDLAAARPRPMTHHVLRAGLDAQGSLIGWRHRLVSENVTASVKANVMGVAGPQTLEGTGDQDPIGAYGLEHTFYAIPNALGEYVREIRGMRVNPWRGVGSGYNRFAAEAFVDEIAAVSGKDPLALRLELTRNQPRAQRVIKTVAEMADFGRRRSDRGLGLAFADIHGTVFAGVAEVSVDRATGKVNVHNYWIAVDAGLVIQPDNVAAQLESGVVFGLSAALLEELTVKGGAIQQSNFNDYPVARMSDVPDIHTRIVASGNPPTGIGEIGLVTVAPAIANGFHQLTGKRLRHLPMSPERVKAALG
jgi:isoquinoline 1-oxidoreductase beta subunit